jgi:FKBP-type peptidyl-prolyl cis-trans isomerase
MSRGQRRGSNKNKTGGPKKTPKKIKKVARVEKQKDQAKKRASAKRSQAPTRTAFERAEVGAVQEQEQAVGTAIVLAHGAGGSSSHASMRAWRDRLAPCCDEVRLFDYGRPYSIPNLVTAHCEAVQSAYDAGHRRIVLAGCSMGARVALHMLTGVPGPDGAPVPRLPAELRSVVTCVLALGYPLLRTGVREVRDAPIRALAADDPPVLFISGDQDPHMDLEALQSACSATDASTAIHVASGAGASLSSKLSPLAGEEAIDAAIASFVRRHAPVFAETVTAPAGADLEAPPAALLAVAAPHAQTAPAQVISTTPDVQFFDGGLEATDLVVGGGSTAVLGRRARVRYNGKLSSGKQFDVGEISFRLGSGEVIQGWDRGVVGMRVGGKRMLRVPPQMGYGARGSPPTVPPNATLLFELDLLSC